MIKHTFSLFLIMKNLEIHVKKKKRQKPCKLKYKLCFVTGNPCSSAISQTDRAAFTVWDFES